MKKVILRPMSNYVLRLITAGLFVSCITVGASGSDSQAGLSGANLLQAMREGGFNIYFRHAQTDWSDSDHVKAVGDLTSCDSSRMRQLSDDGRQTSQAVGDAIRTLGIPVDRILASPYCRTVETAKLMNLGTVETTADIMNLRSASYFGGREAIVRRARARLAEAPPPGTNIILVAHGNVAREATPVYPGEAESVLFRPDGAGGFVYVARLTPAQWQELVNMAE